MIETVTAAGDLVTAIPALWNDLRIPAAIIVLIGGAVTAVMTLRKGVGAAIGVMIGACLLGALVIGSAGILASVKQTTDNHGGITVGQYGR